MSLDFLDSLSTIPTESNMEFSPKELSTLTKGSSCSLEKITRNLRQERRRNPFKDFSVISIINQGKFPVYLAQANHRKYAMKVFSLQKKESENYYHNETRFASLDHPNVVKTVHCEHKQEFQNSGSTFEASFILTEYAPYGDFFELTDNFSSSLCEKLIRTYFQQLIEGLEYLHSKKVVHLDIKLENLLIGNEFILKIADFDTSNFATDPEFFSRGTQYFRAPEIIEGDCKNGTAADVYSAGVVLFAMRSGSYVPHTEARKFEGVDFEDLLWNKNAEFWSEHCRIQKRRSTYFSKDFKDLVNGMLKKKPEDRFTIAQIKSSKWYSGPTFCPEDLQIVMHSIFQ